MTYQVIIRTPDNTDGIYGDKGNLIISEYYLRRHGYNITRVLHWPQKALARLVREIGWS